MAEEQQQAQAPEKKGSGQKPILFIGLAVVNLIFMAVIAYMVFAYKQGEEEKITMKDVVQEEGSEQKRAEAEASDEYVGALVPLETFLVNLSGVRGGRLMKITMSLEVNNEEVKDEIEKRKPEIRDTILILLASKSFDQISSVDGKDFLREEVRDTLNAYLTKGKVKRVLFTEFFYN